MGHLVQNFSEGCGIQTAPTICRGFFDGASPRQQHVMPNGGEGGLSHLFHFLPVVMKVQGCTAIDEVERFVPVEQDALDSIPAYRV